MSHKYLNQKKEFVELKNNIEVKLAEAFSKAPGFIKVDIAKFFRADRPTARTYVIFDKSDVEDKEKESSLILEEAIVRWFELPEIREKYSLEDFGKPVILTGLINTHADG